jgi:hypothetical protein
VIVRGRGPAVAVLVVAGLVLGGCLADAPLPSPSAAPTTEPEPTATVTVHELGRTVWYGGLTLSFGTATATLDAKGGPVVVDLSLANQGSEEANLDGPLTLSSGGPGFEPSRDSVLPAVPAGAAVPVRLTFVVDGSFQPAAGAIRIGRPGEHQAVVPFAPGAGPAVTLEPVTGTLAVEGRAGNLLVQLTGYELRADLPDWHQQLPQGVLALTLDYGATYLGDFAGGLAFTAGNVALVLPDGTEVAPRRDGHSQSVLVLGPRVREDALRSRFEVPSPGGGAYAFLVRNGATTKSVPFTVALP